MPLIKKSFTLEGHRTSVALESEFWDIISNYASANDESISGVVSEIDLSRDAEPLASSLRLFCLKILRKEV